MIITCPHRSKVHPRMNDRGSCLVVLPHPFPIRWRPSLELLGHPCPAFSKVIGGMLLSAGSPLRRSTVRGGHSLG